MSQRSALPETRRGSRTALPWFQVAGASDFICSEKREGDSLEEGNATVMCRALHFRVDNLQSCEFVFRFHFNAHSHESTESGAVAEGGNPTIQRTCHQTCKSEFLNPLLWRTIAMILRPAPVRWIQIPSRRRVPTRQADGTRRGRFSVWSETSLTLHTK